MEVFAPGSEVKCVSSNMVGLVNCVCLYAHGGVLYEIAYWHGGDRKTCWVNEQEITAEVSKQPVGFKAG